MKEFANMVVLSAEEVRERLGMTVHREGRRPNVVKNLPQAVARGEGVAFLFTGNTKRKGNYPNGHVKGIIASEICFLGRSFD